MFLPREAFGAGSNIFSRKMRTKLPSQKELLFLPSQQRKMRYERHANGQTADHLFCRLFFGASKSSFFWWNTYGYSKTKSFTVHVWPFQNKCVENMWIKRGSVFTLYFRNLARLAYPRNKFSCFYDFVLILRQHILQTKTDFSSMKKADAKPILIEFNFVLAAHFSAEKRSRWETDIIMYIQYATTVVKSVKATSKLKTYQ